MVRLISTKLNTSVMTLGTWSILCLGAFLWVLVPGRRAFPEAAVPIAVIPALLLILLAVRSVKAAWAGSVPEKDLLLPFPWRLLVVVARFLIAVAIAGLLAGFLLEIAGPALPPGGPEEHGGSYYVNNHGTLTAVPEDVYRRELRQEERTWIGFSLLGCLTALLVVGEAGKREQEERRPAPTSRAAVRRSTR
jgi:hypothetical protein